MGLAVLHPGLSTTVQDEGRPGYREWGVPVGGAFDRGASALSNALVGNLPSDAVLELTLFGGTYEARQPLALALAGTALDATILHRDGTSRPLAIPTSFPLLAGEVLQLGGVRGATGARTYLAVRGGWQTPIVLGSRSSETRLKAGDLLPAETGTIAFRHPAETERLETGPLRILDGPDTPERFDAGVWERLVFRVGPESDRMGLHLEGSLPEIPSSPDRLSSPILPGALQVAGGRLIALGVACGTMGGYPHVAQILTADLDRMAQARPGTELRFRRVTLAEARRIDRDARARRLGFLGRVRAACSDANPPGAVAEPSG